MTRHIPEVLAPAGSPEALKAAVRCGAAAVYLGVDQFNARRAAHNFTLDTLPEAVAYCHQRGTAVHLTLNTLLRQEELPAAIDIAEKAAACGVDALIIQDVGLARRLRAIMPSMPLHASTQLSCHTPAGVQFLRDAGFSRVVLAREMTQAEIAACAGLGVELEVFVHGALCMSVSGQCYFSAMLGGRSGNRGACAQTCRLPFEPTGKHARPCPSDKAALSLKDNCLAAYVQALADIGVTSLKIEGRMKRPEYVAAATTVYRAAANHMPIQPDALDTLQKVFSRTGFTDGYFTDTRGASMFGTRRKEDVTAAADVLDNLQRLYEKEQPLISITMDFQADETACTLTVADADAHTVTITDAGAQPAIHKPLTTLRVREQLEKTGGTPFVAQEVNVSIQSGLTLPISRLNALRRQALEKLLAARTARPVIPCDRTAQPPSLSAKTAPPHRIIARLSSAKQYSPALQVDEIILPISTPAATIRHLADICRVGVEIPRGLFGREDALRTALTVAKQAGAVSALCGNVGALPLAQEAGLEPVGGFSLNITNPEALAFYAERGLRAATLSMELTFEQIKKWSYASIPTGLLLYGRQPLMLTRNCPVQTAAHTCANCHEPRLTDRTGTVFPIACDGGCREVLNSVPLYWADRPAEVPARDFTLLHFTIETAAEVVAVTQAYRSGKSAPPTAITRGLYRRGVE